MSFNICRGTLGSLAMFGLAAPILKSLQLRIGYRIVSDLADCLTRLAVQVQAMVDPVARIEGDD